MDERIEKLKEFEIWRGWYPHNDVVYTDDDGKDWTIGQIWGEPTAPLLMARVRANTFPEACFIYAVETKRQEMLKYLGQGKPLPSFVMQFSFDARSCHHDYIGLWHNSEEKAKRTFPEPESKIIV